MGKDVQQRNSHTLLVSIYIGLTMSEYISTKAKHSPHDTAIPLLVIYPREMRAYVHQKTCTTIMFKAAENNPNVHEENGYIMTHSYNGIPQSNKELLTHATTWINHMILHWPKDSIVSAWFHLYEAQDEAELIYRDRRQNSGFSQGTRRLLTGNGHKGTFWGGRMYCILIWVIVGGGDRKGQGETHIKLYH